MSTQKSNYKAMADRIRACKSYDACQKTGRSLDNLYDAGIFTINQYGRLSMLLLDRKIELDPDEKNLEQQLRAKYQKLGIQVAS